MAGTPSWQEVAATLRDRIARGVYPLASLVPSTSRMQAEFGVSSTPVRRAMDELTREGLVRGEVGRGVRVVGAPDSGLSTVEERLAEHDARLRRIEDHLGLE